MSLKKLLFFPFFMTLVIFLFLPLHQAQSAELYKEGKNNYITLKKNEDGKNQHPFHLSEEAVTHVLSGISITQDDNDRGTAPLFSGHQVTLLATYLPIALKQAKPDEDIVFSLSKEVRTLGGLKKQTLYVTGSVFIENDRLNILIGEFDKAANRAYEMAYDPTAQGLVKYSFSYGHREQQAFGFSKPLTFTATGLAFGRENRYDWITASTDLTALAKESVPLVQQPDLSVAPASSAKHSAAKQETLITRFKRLETLKKAKLISEEEYQEKRQQLLDQL